ncbi:hypothetical protein RclHR1_21580002 [Rhizophagus clarus]|uniref:Uncharacterized protein n=1 Tax=Rhizophagus clarus TaxID=94130 RepID=A0A2Z6QT61_9GLOM|nr:hypothetical protein RclHR1_21580002 [Rhizophagus clarus]
MATPSHPPIVNENNKPIKGSALIRLYKPANIFPISFSLFHVCPYLSCDTRGAGTLFNTKKARYYLLSLGQLKTTGIRTNNFSVIINDTDLPGAQKDGMKPATVLKQLHHCPTKQMPYNGSMFNFVHNGFPLQAIRNNTKRLRQKYKRKIKLPPLPPNFVGDAIAYYQEHHRIHLNLPCIRECYRHDFLVLAGIIHCDQIISYIDTIRKVPQKMVQDVTPDHY